jgi:hypothetical protein
VKDGMARIIQATSFIIKRLITAVK